MKKKLFIALLIGFISGILLTNNVYSSYYSNNIISNTTTSNLVKSNSIAMMLETEAGSGEYEVSTSSEWPDSSEYTFNADISKCENGATLSWDSENNTVVMTGSTSDKCYIYFDVYVLPTIADVCNEGDTLANCVQDLYKEAGEATVGLYYFDGTGDYTNAELEAEDYSYRYSGSSDEVLNFVCFGSDDCSDTNNLYRIIGVFDDGDGYQVKLIKYDYATSSLLGTDGDYYDTYSGKGWDTSYYLGSTATTEIGTYYWSYANYTESYFGSKYFNDWSYSELNTINLNSNYLTNIGGTWSNIITTHAWIVGGDDGSYTKSVYTYTGEIENPSDQLGYTTYKAKIGLMYVSDYAYAADPTYWNTALYLYDSDSGAYAEDWMFMGLIEWTITRYSYENTNYNVDLNETAAYEINDVGNISFGTSWGAGLAIRPTFYLTSSVQYSSGSGTANDPIILLTE